jgi:hypothetical protein
MAGQVAPKKSCWFDLSPSPNLEGHQWPFQGAFDWLPDIRPKFKGYARGYTGNFWIYRDIPAISMALYGTVRYLHWGWKTPRVGSGSSQNPWHPAWRTKSRIAMNLGRFRTGYRAEPWEPHHMLDR